MFEVIGFLVSLLYGDGMIRTSAVHCQMAKWKNHATLSDLMDETSVWSQ